MRPRARLIALIGEELISDEPVAIVELVKNSYDADAGKVDVRFEGETAEHPTRIVVEDNGCGMSLRTVLGAWLEPATNSKRTTDASPGGRLYLGAKGIGRFAAARLAKKLRLETKRKIDKRGVIVDISWEDFEKNKYLEDIKIKYEVKTIPDLEHGTRLIMEPVLKEWKHEDYDKLHTRLSRLISPFKDIKGFVINLSIPWHPDLHGEVQAPELVSQPRYRLEGQLDDDGNFSGKMVFDEKTLKTFNKLKLGGHDAKPLCGGFEVELRAWDRDREGLEPLGEKLGLGIAEMRRTLNAYCGVTIYRDGFRVHPYGETGNDWARLDLRSRQNPGMNLANNQVIASVKISRTSNPSLLDKSNREGMVLNDEHVALEDWFKLVLAVLERERYDLRPRKESTEGVQPLFEAFDLTPTVKEVRSQLGSKHPVTKLVSDAGENIKKGVERVQDAFSRLLMLSGLGQMVDIVIHEIGAPVGKIGRQLVTIEKEVNLIPDTKAREKVMETLSPLRAWLDQVLLLRQRLDPQTPSKRGRATSFSVKDAVEDCFHLCEALLNGQGIKTEITEPNGSIRAKMSRAVLDQILYNLTDNAIFWISQQHGGGKGGRIHVQVKKSAGGFRIIFCDDGTGISQEDRTRIFEPYFTTKPNGMGLGLHIARMVIEPYGKLVLHEEGDLAGACFEAQFERNVGL
jgi:hypothetical protein